MSKQRKETTPAAFRKQLLGLFKKNVNGVWFVQVDDDRLVALRKWMWPFCEIALPDAEVIGRSSPTIVATGFKT